MIDDGDVIAILGFVHVVGGHEHGGADVVTKFADMLPDRVARLRIEAESWLIQEEHFGMMEKSPGNFQTPFHASQECSYQGFSAIPEIDHRQDLLGSSAENILRYIVEASVELEVFFRRKPLVERLILKHEPDILANLGRMLQYVMPSQGGRSAGGLKQRR